MANYKAIANGNADTLAIWNVWNGSAWVAAGSLPSTSDDVYTNSYIVTVTTSQSYKSWNRSSVGAPYNITQGGQFQIDGSNVITTQGTVNGSNANFGTQIASNACIYRLSTHLAKWTHIGLIVCGLTNRTSAVWNTGASDTDIVGDMETRGSNTASIAFINSNYTGNLSIIGNQRSDGVGLIALWMTGCNSNVNILGNQYGGVTSGILNAIAFDNNGNTGNINIVGNQYGGSGTGSNATNLSGTLLANITGNQYAGSSSVAVFINTASSRINILGNSYASAGFSAIYANLDTTIITHQGNIVNNLGVLAIRCMRLFLNVTPTTVWQFSDFDGDTQYLYGAGVNTGHPIEANVRKDTVYGPSSEFTGTAAIPPKASVALNVPVDDMVGELVTATTPADFIAALKADDLGVRLGKCATTEEVDSTVRAFENNV